MAQARVLSEIELNKVLQYCANHTHPERNRAMLLMTHLAGMRVGEVAALRVKDVLNSEGEIKDEVHLSASQTKGRKGRTVLIPQRLREELKRYLCLKYGLKKLAVVNQTDTDIALFHTQKHPKRGFTSNTLTQLFHYIYQRAGIDGASSHSGRRGFITNLAEKGINVRVLMALAGHQSLATTQKYIDLNPKMMRNAVELI
jgi:integrase/recombinase XerD